MGDPTLDGMLGGGLPDSRATLLVGGPGTGKTTLAMQFLQAGLEEGETALFVSTEQTVEELRDSFSEFSFELDDENLSFLTVHAAPGRTFEGDGRALTIQRLGRGPDATLEESDAFVPDPAAADDGFEGMTQQPATGGGDASGSAASEGTAGADASGAIDPGSFGDAFARPFDRENLLEYLRPHGPCDRVVFDSVSGLSAVGDGSELFRRAVLDLIRFFSDEFGATTVFTAEAGDRSHQSRLLRFTTHGVIELRRDPVQGDPHRFLEIRKLRGVDHDRRTVELEVVPSGIRVAPNRRSQPPALKDHAHRPIGIDGLDALCGGGLVRGAGVLLRHDGRATLSALFGTLMNHALSAGDDLTLVPTNGLRESRVRALLEGHDWALERLMREGRLSVVDLVGVWDDSLPAVHDPGESAADLAELLASLNDDDARTATLCGADTIVHAYGLGGAREVRYGQSRRLDPDDTLVHVSNPETIADRAAAFYRDAAEQVVETWVADDGLQYVTLRKSPCGFVGSTSLVEYVADPPYVRVQDPPATRETPAAER
jgi:KaiC/GvpD/RAD55 family RecA-like ATPase